MRPLLTIEEINSAIRHNKLDMEEVEIEDDPNRVMYDMIIAMNNKHAKELTIYIDISFM